MGVLSGGSVDLTFARDSGAFSAMLFAGYPGQEGGTAVADTLFGKNNPSGRLTQTFYPSDFVGAWRDPSTSFFDMQMRPNVSTGNPGRGYRFYTGDPVFSFGYGLSYTTFSYEGLPSRLDCPAAICQLQFSLTNTGSRKGRHSVLAFLEPLDADGPRSLRTFALAELDAGEKTLISLDFGLQDFEVVDDKGARALHTGRWIVQLGSQLITAVVSASYMEL